MGPTGLHLLLTYQCTLECEHCFVFGSPWQNGTMTLSDVENVLGQAKAFGGLRSIYFEGGEPFLYYGTLLESVRMANELGFQAGIVSNAYWATSVDDAIAWLQPFVGRLSDLSVSSDLFHWSEDLSRLADHAAEAAEKLGIPLGTISIAPPEADDAQATLGQTPTGASKVLFRGRAWEKLAPSAPKRPWQQFTTCPHEELATPGRLHVDPFGHIHVCQGITAGSMFELPLRQLWDDYAPDRHPIVGPLLAGGPAELARRYEVPLNEQYADACALCFHVRSQLRGRFPHVLAPDQMYGVVSGAS